MDEFHEQRAKEAIHKRTVYDYTHIKLKSKKKKKQTIVLRCGYSPAKSLQILKTN